MSCQHTYVHKHTHTHIHPHTHILFFACTHLCVPSDSALPECRNALWWLKIDLLGLLDVISLTRLGATAKSKIRVLIFLHNFKMLFFLKCRIWSYLIVDVYRNLDEAVIFFSVSKHFQRLMHFHGKSRLWRVDEFRSSYKHLNAANYST